MQPGPSRSVVMDAALGNNSKSEQTTHAADNGGGLAGHYSHQGNSASIKTTSGTKPALSVLTEHICAEESV